MPVDRPTFSESWYRVAELRPRLRSTVQIHRQHYRGRMWYVLQDPSNNQFFRQNEAAYHFVALLDGTRTVADVWRACNEELGDAAPTQGEAIQLLGQLYTTNLIQCELPPDAEGLFERHRKRVTREVRGYLMNLLFIRIPLYDPDRFLERWVRVFGKFFTGYAFILWLGIISTGLYFVVDNWGDLTKQSENVLDPENLPLLYVSFIFIKVIHEFGHGFACKKFGQRSGGGEVHVMGVMFLVFTPLPYVDASSAWAFRNKWHRVVTGAGGILVELAVAAVAAVVWAQTQSGTTIHTITYNMMFLASVSTLLFNANPLLRFDGYYILSDLLEIPNLSQRSRQYLYYLVRRYVWAARNPRNPAHTRGERAWFVFYGIASTLYRVFICVRILLFVADKLFFVGAILAVVAIVAWVMVPLGKFLHFLFTNGELARVRGRAIASTAAVLVGIVVTIGMVPMTDHHRSEGIVDIVDPEKKGLIFAEADGKIVAYMPNCRTVGPADALVNCDNDVLETELIENAAALAKARLELDRARRDELIEEKPILKKILSLAKEQRKLAKDKASLTIRPQIAGTWIAPGIEGKSGAFVRAGDPLGMVVAVDHLVIRCTVGQEAQALLIAEAERSGSLHVEIRAKGRPSLELTGSARAEDISPAGRKDLSTPAQALLMGGGIQTAAGDTTGMKAAEGFFEVRIKPDISASSAPADMLMPYQRVVVRFSLPPKPLIQQWWRLLQQLIQKRFRI